jgi:hypothetical protein
MRQNERKVMTRAGAGRRKRNGSFSPFMADFGAPNYIYHQARLLRAQLSLFSHGLILEIVLFRCLWKTFNGAIFVPYLYVVFKL